MEFTQSVAVGVALTLVEVAVAIAVLVPLAEGTTAAARPTIPSKWKICIVN
jgi:hypothetical protein